MSELAWPLDKMAEHMDLQPRRLQQLATEGILEKKPKGARYPVKKTLVAYIRFLRERKPSGEDHSAKSINSLREMQRAEIALNMEIKRGTRIPIDDIEEVAGKFFDTIAGIIKQRKGRQVTDETIADVFAEIRDAMRGLSELIKAANGSA